jgi:hypothetical protein
MLSSPPVTRGRKTRKEAREREAGQKKVLDSQFSLAKFGYSLRGSSEN